MPPVPAQPKIYHILHVDRLPSVLASGGLLSDAVMSQRQAGTTIGMSRIKSSRLTTEVPPHPGTFIGDYVPFYFCPRSIMLYVISCRNHPDLTYRGGQQPIIHLEADLHAAVRWAQQAKKKWAFTLCNAAAAYARTQFRAKLQDLDDIDWPAIAATKWGAAEVREHKQAEFLLHEGFPWVLVERIGVHSSTIQQQVYTALQSTAHRPRVDVLPNWYY